MSTYGIDYLTLSFKLPKTQEYANMENGEVFRFILRFFRLYEYFGLFDLFGKNKWYKEVYKYKDIQIKLPDEESKDSQGYCVEFSSKALAFYNEVLEKQKISLKSIISNYMSLAEGGFDVRVTRLDVCIDDKQTDESKALLKLDKIFDCVINNEVVSLLRSASDEKDLIAKSKQVYKKKLLGCTINFGNRKSNAFCRFYDKRVEQLQKGEAVPDDVKHWVRCEFEFKKERALSVALAFMNMSEKEFAVYIREVFNYYLRFVTKKGNNVSRYEPKRWWSKFLASVKRSKLVFIPSDRNRYVSSMRWLRRSVFPTLYSILKCITIDDFLLSVVSEGGTRQRNVHKQIADDFIEETVESNITGIARLMQCTPIEKQSALRAELEKRYREMQRMYKELHKDVYINPYYMATDINSTIDNWTQPNIFSREFYYNDIDFDVSEKFCSGERHY